MSPYWFSQQSLTGESVAVGNQYCKVFGRELLALVVVGLVATAGCGSGSVATYPVKGKVTYPDGTTVSGGMVEFASMVPEGTEEPKRFNARGRIHSDGSYFLTTFENGDGVVPGHHRAIVQEPYPVTDMEEGRPASSQNTISEKYWHYNTSGLEFEVKEEENEIDIVVTRSKKNRP